MLGQLGVKLHSVGVKVSEALRGYFGQFWAFLCVNIVQDSLTMASRWLKMASSWLKMMQRIWMMLVGQRLLLRTETLVIANLVNVVGLRAIRIYFTLWFRHARTREQNHGAENQMQQARNLGPHIAANTVNGKKKCCV